MIDHVSIQCADLTASATFYDTVLAPLGGRRIMDFGEAIGRTASRRSGSDARRATASGSRTSRSGARPGRRRCVLRVAVAAGAEALHEPRVWPEYHPGDHGGRATPTATTSRPSTTRLVDWSGDSRRQSRGRTRRLVGPGRRDPRASGRREAGRRLVARRARRRRVDRARPGRRRGPRPVHRLARHPDAVQLPRPQRRLGSGTPKSSRVAAASSPTGERQHLVAHLHDDALRPRLSLACWRPRGRRRRRPSHPSRGCAAPRCRRRRGRPVGRPGGPVRPSVMWALAGQPRPTGSSPWAWPSWSTRPARTGTRSSP